MELPGTHIPKLIDYPTAAKSRGARVLPLP